MVRASTCTGSDLRGQKLFAAEKVGLAWNNLLRQYARRGELARHFLFSVPFHQKIARRAIEAHVSVYVGGRLKALSGFSRGGMNSLDSQLWRELKKHRSNSELSRRTLPCGTPAGRGPHINTCCPRLIKDIGAGEGGGCFGKQKKCIKKGLAVKTEGRFFTEKGKRKAKISEPLRCWVRGIMQHG